MIPPLPYAFVVHDRGRSHSQKLLEAMQMQYVIFTYLGTPEAVIMRDDQRWFFDKENARVLPCEKGVSITTNPTRGSITFFGGRN